MITVIIPTARRAPLLRTALESVAAQTAIDKVDRILVSENGGDRDSEAVCGEFSSLPITYLFRTPTTPLEHGKFLMNECLDGELTAFLHDDDWWAPGHLANAISALDAHSNAAIYTSSHFVVASESSMLNCCGNLFPWFASNYAPFKSVWELSRLNVLLGELLGTIAHYSTSVSRTEILKKARFVYDLNNPFDNDRMLFYAMSSFGSLLFNPTPEVFVRNHEIQDCFTFNNDARFQHMCGTTRWMVEISGKPWNVLANTFAKRMAMCPEKALSSLQSLSMKPWCIPEMNRNMVLDGPILPVQRKAELSESMVAMR